MIDTNVFRLREVLIIKFRIFSLDPWQWGQSQDISFIPSIPLVILKRYMKMVTIYCSYLQLLYFIVLTCNSCLNLNLNCI
jgi:hypothetical protein